MKSMLNHKVVVVTQKDTWEGHYRFMEAISSGTLVFSDPIIAPPKHFVAGHDYVVYKSFSDLQDKLVYYLNCPKERLRIAYNGWAKTMTTYRSYHMMERMLLPATPTDI